MNHEGGSGRLVRLSRLGQAARQALADAGGPADDMTDQKKAQLEIAFRSQLLDNTVDSIFVHDMEGHFIYVNEAACKTHGYTFDEFITMPLSRLDTPGSAALIDERTEFLLARGEAVFEAEHFCKDGSVLPVEVHARVIEMNGRKLISSAVRDITERKKAQQALLEAKDHAESIIRTANVMVVGLDLDGNIRSFNENAEIVTGYQAEEVIGRSWFDIFLPNDRYYETAAKVRRLLAEGNLPVKAENPILTKTGEERRIAWRNSSLREQGKITGMISFGMDVTERWRAEELFQTLADRSPVGIFIVEDGKFKYVNPRFCEYLGHAREELIDSDSLQMVSPEYRGTVREMAVRMLRGEQSSPYEYLVRDSEGQERWMMEVCTSIQYQGKRASLGTCMDATENKKLQRAMAEYRHLDKMKTDLLSTVSHELRTPLATIKGYSTMLIDYDEFLKRDEKREYLESIDKATDRLTELVDHLLDMSRLEAGLLKLEKMPTNLVQMVATSVAEAQLRAPGHHITMEQAGRVPRVNVDARRIRQVIDNVLDNAIKYSREETDITVRIKRLKESLVISVADQGIGISKEDLPRIFNRMYRAKQRLSPQVSGLGLGLGLCKGLVEAHGGSIWMDSELGKGSTCFFSLPLRADAEKEDQA